MTHKVSADEVNDMDMRRIGTRMKSVLSSINSRPASSRGQLARQYSGSNCEYYCRIYDVVARLRTLDFVKVDPEHKRADAGSKGAVVITDAGEAFVEEHLD